MLRMRILNKSIGLSSISPSKLHHFSTFCLPFLTIHSVCRPPARFANSSDPKVVSVCWIELCLWAEEVVQPEDRVLDRPIPYACPVEGEFQPRVWCTLSTKTDCGDVFYRCEEPEGSFLWFLRRRRSFHASQPTILERCR